MKPKEPSVNSQILSLLGDFARSGEKMHFSSKKDALREVKKNVWAFLDVPDELKDAEICRIAVESNSLLLAHVPEELKTPELCRIAVEEDPTMLEYVPENIKYQFP